MVLRIPQELQKYVRMSKKEGLIHSDDMPEELLSLFEETKQNVVKAEQKHKNEIEKQIYNYTYADMQQWEESTLTELIEGQKIDKPSPWMAHHRVFGNLLLLLSNQLHQNKEYQLLHYIGIAPFAKPDDQPQDIDTVVVPDISILKQSHPMIDDSCFAGPPELIIEVLEERTKDYEEQTKLRLYECAGIPEVWFVYAERKEVFVYRYNGKSFDVPEVVKESDGADGIVPNHVTGGSIPLSEIFGE